MPDLPPIPVKIRTFQPGDAPVVKKLYLEGLVGGSIAENDTGLDMDDIPAAYLSSPGSHFWVAENPDDEIIGTIGVQQHETAEGEIRRLRVRADSRRRGVGTALLEVAVRFCQERQYLKVTLDTFMDREPALKLFEKFHFRLSRTRQIGEKDLLYFYLDLYYADRQPPKKES